MGWPHSHRPLGDEDACLHLINISTSVEGRWKLRSVVSFTCSIKSSYSQTLNSSANLFQLWPAENRPPENRAHNIHLFFGAKGPGPGPEYLDLRVGLLESYLTCKAESQKCLN